MEEKVRKCLALYGLILPSQVKNLIIELAAEIDRLRAEVAEIKRSN